MLNSHIRNCGAPTSQPHPAFVQYSNAGIFLNIIYKPSTYKKSFLAEAHLAEREGFEPPLVLPKAVFKTAAINHSAISPGAKIKQFLIPQSNLNYPNADLFVYLYIVKIN